MTGCLFVKLRKYDFTFVPRYASVLGGCPMHQLVVSKSSTKSWTSDWTKHCSIFTRKSLDSGRCANSFLWLLCSSCPYPIKSKSLPYSAMALAPSRTAWVPNPTSYKQSIFYIGVLMHSILCCIVFFVGMIKKCALHLLKWLGSRSHGIRVNRLLGKDIMLKGHSTECHWCPIQPLKINRLFHKEHGQAWIWSKFITKEDSLNIMYLKTTSGCDAMPLIKTQMSHVLPHRDCGNQQGS